MTVVTPDWPSPANVRALITTRLGGVSQAPFGSLNLGFHVGDSDSDVAANWRRVMQHTALATQPQLLNQVHGSQVVEQASVGPEADPVNADGVYTRQLNNPCVILSADCLPVLLCNSQGTQVAALHAGWRGLAAGVIDAGVATFAKDDELLAFLGPAICGKCFQVGAEVVKAFKVKFSEAVPITAVEACFVRQGESHWLADIYQLARLNLQQLGIKAIYGGNYCTVEQPDKFYSYRRDDITGRIASMIWLENGL